MTTADLKTTQLFFRAMRLMWAENGCDQEEEEAKKLKFLEWFHEIEWLQIRRKQVGVSNCGDNDDVDDGGDGERGEWEEWDNQ